MRRARFRTTAYNVGAILAATAVAATGLQALAHPAGHAAKDTRSGHAVRKAPPRANPPVIFPQTQSDLVYDPAARFGRLANGMTYVIYKNKTPPGAANVWLRVAAGSMMEQEDQQGLAHFIEHMAFNGSKNVPEGEMVKLLERDGLAFGPDTNAQTSSLETLYMLNLPDANPRVVGDALFLMRETAGNITFDPGAIDRERGVVLGEERARGGTPMRAYEALLKALFPGQKYSERLPIGKVDVLKTAQRPAFVRFYNDFYRPEYTTLIVAGDVDVDAVEAQIQQRFADWVAGPRSPAALTDFGRLAARTKPSAQLFVAEGLADSMSVSWVFPPVDILQTKSKDHDELLFLIAKDIVGERFDRAAKSPDAAFLAAGFQREDVRHTGRLYSLGIRPKDGRNADAFAQAMGILRDFAANGPSQKELDLALERYEGFFRASAASARTRPTTAIANSIVNALRSDGVFQSPAQDLAEFQELKPSFTLAAMGAALKKVRIDGPPTLWREGERAEPFDQAKMLAAYHAAMAAPIRSGATHASAPWPYTQFGAPSVVVSREALADLGATRVVFANGVALTVKQTDFDDDAVYVSIKLGDGYRGVRPEQAAVLHAADQIGLFSGGLGKLSSDDIREALAGKVYAVNFGIGGLTSSLGGATTKADFPTQLQLLAAFMTDPAFRPEGLEQYKASLASSYAAMKVSPSGVYDLKAAGAAYGDDPRFSTPSKEALLAITQDDIAALMRDQLGHGPVEVTIVGDLTTDEAIAQVGATLGALPPRPPAVSVEGVDPPRFPTRDLHRIYTHDGRADQNMSLIAWPTTDYYSDPQRGVGLELLAAVLKTRELDEVREKQGASYGVSVQSAASTSFPGFGYLETSASVRPEVDETYYRTVAAIVADLKAQPVGLDELTRARQPMIDRLRNQRNANGYWLALLSEARDPKKLAAATTRESALMAVTPADLQRLAQTYLDMSRALRIQVKPRTGSSPK